MPIYEYQCECGEERMVRLPFSEFGQPQICECEKVMQRLISAPNFIIRQTGRGMALDTLNDKHGGMPNKHWKADAEQYAAQGL